MLKRKVQMLIIYITLIMENTSIVKIKLKTTNII